MALPLDFPDDFFDCVYCVSVLTHLSEELHHAWLQEIRRILAPGGLFLASTHGDHCRDTDLSPSECRAYHSGELVVRDSENEGKKLLSAFHSPQFVRARLLDELEVVEHVCGPAHSTLPQDVGVARRRRREPVAS